VEAPRRKALRFAPKLASSLYGRGLAKLKKSDTPVAMPISRRRRQSRRRSSAISRARACSEGAAAHPLWVTCQVK
jgi:hypothetical protein